MSSLKACISLHVHIQSLSFDFIFNVFVSLSFLTQLQSDITSCIFMIVCKRKRLVIVYAVYTKLKLCLILLIVTFEFPLGKV
jgi:hypothetical protein